MACQFLQDLVTLEWVPCVKISTFSPPSRFCLSFLSSLFSFWFFKIFFVVVFPFFFFSFFDDTSKVHRGAKCQWCHMDANVCVGHFGHIEFTRPVFHPMYLGVILKILQSICLGCCSLLIDPTNEVFLSHSSPPPLLSPFPRA
jgi:hypothetical protein